MIGSCWQSPPNIILLKTNEIHIWRAFISSDQVENYKNLLTDEEMYRAGKYFFERDRQRYILSRGILKKLLSSYAKVKPENIQFIYNKYGKPYLNMPSRSVEIQFNISHSEDIILLAFTYGHKIGIDIEYQRAEFADMKIAEHFFSPAEISALAMLPDNMRKKAFFECWTRKEAFIKAKGQGLTIPLDGFEVSVMPDEPAQLLNIYDDPEEVKRWMMMNIETGGNYCGALVTESDTYSVFFYDWKDSTYRKNYFYDSLH